MTKKIKKPKRRLLFTAFAFLMCLLLCTTSVFGAVAQFVPSLNDGGVASRQFAAQGGELKTWNSKEHAFEIGEGYAYGIIPDKNKSSTITAGKKYLYSGSQAPEGFTDESNYCFNLTKAKEEEGNIPDITIVYKNYRKYDPYHAFANDAGYVPMEIHATIKSASLVYNESNEFDKRALVSIRKELLGGFCRVVIVNIGEIQIKYDFYAVSGSTKEEYHFETNLTYRDVDGAQGIAFKGFGLDYNGDPEKVKAANPNSRLSFGVTDDNWYLFNGEIGAEPTDYARNAFGLVAEINGTGYITYISGQYKVFGEEADYGNPRGKVALFSPSTYSWFAPEWTGPHKTITDNNESYVLANTVPNMNNARWTYNISQEVPNGLLDAYYPSAFEIRDKLDSCLKINSVYVDHRNGGAISGWFDIKIDHDTNEVVATARPEALTNPLFYGGENGNTINVHIDVTLDVAKSEASDHEHVEDGIWKGMNGVENGENPTPASRRIVYVDGDEDTSYTNEVITSTGQGDLPKPGPANKTVSDNDESDTNANMLTTPDERYTYSINHALPEIWPPIDEETGEEGDMPYYNSYEFTDTLEDILRPISAKVVSGGTDVSEDFHISINGQKVIATMTQPALVTDDSYGRDYSLVIETELRTDKYYTPAHLAPWLSADGVTLTIPNNAFVVAVDSEGTNYDSPTNNVITIVDLPTITYEQNPGIEIHKSVEPYEFQIKDEIPYKITFQQNNPDATAMDVVVRDDTMPRGLNIKPGSIKVSGISRAYTCEIIEGGLELRTKYLDYGDTVTIDFIAVAEKNLNGQVIPNEVTASAWGVPDNSDSTTIYLNSPKIDVQKKVSKQGHSSVNNTINYEVSIKQIHPGCFMRDIWFEDEILTDGVELEKGSFSVSDTDGNVLALGTDYKLNIQDNKFKIVFTKANMGYHDTEAEEGALNPYIPPWDDPRGQNAKYYFKRAADSNETDYENLELQKEYVITYSAVVDDSILGGREVKNHAIVPSTENTNGDIIRDDPNIPSGGGEDEVVTYVDGPDVIVDKEADKREYNVGDIAEYKIQVGMVGADMTAKYVVIKDKFEQEGIAKINAESIKVRYNNTDITWQTKIKVTDDLQGFTIETGRDLTEKDNITVEYLAEILGDGVLPNTVRATADNAPEVDWTNDIIVTPAPDLTIEKTSDEKIYTVGDKATYQITVKQPVPGATAKSVTVRDSFLQEGMVIDKDSFEVMLNDEYITDKCIVNAEENKWRIETRRNMTNLDTLVITYDVTFTDRTLPGTVNNIAITVSENVPEVETEYEVEIKEIEPDLEIIKSSDKAEYAVGETGKYTVTVRQAKEGAVARNIVINDNFLQTGMKIKPKTIKVMMGDEDITDECSIKATSKNWVVRTDKELRVDETISVSYDVVFHALSAEEEQTYYVTDKGTETIVENLKKSERIVRNVATTEGDNAPKKETEHIIKLRKPVLKVEKSSDDNDYAVGEKGKYTLIVTQDVEGGVAEQVVIEDKFDTKGVKVDRASFVVKYGKRDITSNCKIEMKGDTHFIIETKEDLKFGEIIKVTYKVEFKDEKLLKKKIRNDVLVEADNADPGKDKNVVKIKSPLANAVSDAISGDKGGTVKTGDDSMIWPAIVFACMALLGIIMLLAKRNRKEE